MEFVLRSAFGSAIKHCKSQYLNKIGKMDGNLWICQKWNNWNTMEIPFEYGDIWTIRIAINDSQQQISLIFIAPIALIKEFEILQAMDEKIELEMKWNDRLKRASLYASLKICIFYLILFKFFSLSNGTIWYDNCWAFLHVHFVIPYLQVAFVCLFYLHSILTLEIRDSSVFEPDNHNSV